MRSSSAAGSNLQQRARDEPRQHATLFAVGVVDGEEVRAILDMCTCVVSPDGLDEFVDDGAQSMRILEPQGGDRFGDTAQLYSEAEGATAS